ncbi:unnamed protein product, partial [marine sediment metagenome]
GAVEAGEYPRRDLIAYDDIGQNGERILPFYRYDSTWEGLYTIHGGFTDWANDGLGIIAFLNELWNSSQYFNSPELIAQRRDPNSPISGNKSRYFFDDHLEFGDQFVEWKEYDHPDFGKVELGGSWKKFTRRLPPRFMLEELCHRNMAFTLYQANEMPLMQMGETKVENINGDVYKVWVDLTNPKVAPTILERAAQNNVVRPDILTIDGRNVEVISASWITNKVVEEHRPGISSIIDQRDLKRIIVRNGHPGKTTRTIQYLVKGS